MFCQWCLWERQPGENKKIQVKQWRLVCGWNFFFFFFIPFFYVCEFEFLLSSSITKNLINKMAKSKLQVIYDELNASSLENEILALLDTVLATFRSSM